MSLGPFETIISFQIFVGKAKSLFLGASSLNAIAGTLGFLF